jgi:hypothetical protein
VAREGGDRAGVRQIARAEQKRRLLALERGDPLLEAAMQLHVARDQARGAGADSPAHRRVGGGLAHLWVVREAEVVV